jgi:hypothetical protein
MMEMQEFLKFAANAGVGGLLAAFIFYVHHRAMQKQADESRGREDLLITLVTNNTQTMANNTSVNTELRHELRTLIGELRQDILESRSRRRN